MKRAQIRRKDELGQVFTPTNIASLMAKLLLGYEPQKVIDPSVGSGALLKAVTKVDNHQEILGLDIDPEWIAFLKEDGYNVELKDFFDFSEKVNGIIMNPPYIRHEKLSDKKNTSLNKEVLLSKLSNPSIPSQANLYVYFIYKALLSLEKNGVLVAIMPNTWLTSAFGSKLQELILNKYTVNTIINFNENIFKGYDVDVSIFVIQNCVSKKSYINVYDIQGDISETDIENIINDETSQNITVHRVLQQEIGIYGWYKYRENIVFLMRNLISLKMIFTITRGITTNSNSFFIRDIDDVVANDYSEFFLPLLNKARDVRGYSIEKEEINKVLFSTNIGKHELPQEVKKIVDEYESTLLNTENPKTLFDRMSRKPNNWFNIRAHLHSGIVFNYIIRDEVRFLFNDAVAVPKDNFYLMIPFESLNVPLYIAILNSSFTRYFLEISGRSYGTGLLKIQKYELEELPILDWKVLSLEDLDCLVHYGELLISNGESEILNKIDEVLSKYYLSESLSLNEFYVYLQNIITKRRRKNG